MKPNRRQALVALLLLAPIPSFGVIAAMVVSPGPVGHAVFLAAKTWLVVFPATWFLAIEKEKPSWSPPSNGGLGAGALSGVVLGLTISGGALLSGAHTMDLGPLNEKVAEMGLASPLTYLAGATAWTLVNSLIEEYVYRWFVFRQCETLFRGPLAMVVSAGIFTAHHIIAVSQYLDPVLTVVASTGVFGGGLVWAWLYRRYRSIWPGWISHVIADVAVFGVGGWLLFG